MCSVLPGPGGALTAAFWINWIREFVEQPDNNESQYSSLEVINVLTNFPGSLTDRMLLILQILLK